MCKMALFSVLFLLPCLLSLLCDLHHLSVLLRWFPHTIGCKSRGGALSGACVRPALPPALPYLLGPTMGLTAGMATGLWMLSPKTLNSWKRWCCCGGGKENNRSGKTANGGAGSGTGMVSMHRPAGSSSEFGESGKHFKGFSHQFPLLSPPPPASAPPASAPARASPAVPLRLLPSPAPSPACRSASASSAAAHRGPLFRRPGPLPALLRHHRSPPPTLRAVVADERCWHKLCLWRGQRGRGAKSRKIP